jgi:putative ABC transport system permease protein
MTRLFRGLAVHLSILRQDLHYTARTLSHSRGFAFTAVLVTALGVGANTAALSVADFVLFRPLPYRDSESLWRLCEGPREGAGWGCMNQLSPANYRDFKAGTTSFESMGVFTGGAANLVGAGEPQRVQGARVTPELLPMLGVRPVLGRVFDSTNAGEVDANTVVLSHGLWQSRFARDPGVLGRTVNLDGLAYTVIGVMPAGFHFPSREVQVWTPLLFQADDFEDRGNSYVDGVVRLKPGVNEARARADLMAVAFRLADQFPESNYQMGISFFRMRDEMSPRYRVLLLALVGAGLAMLLLTCANLANLLLARAAGRERELAVRSALGAGRERLIRQMITESVTLALIGGIAGVLVAVAALPLLARLVPNSLPIASQPAIDLRVLTIAALCTGLTAIGFGIFPAVRAGGQAAFDALREGARGGGGRKQRLRGVLVTLEVAMSVALLITAGLLIRAIWRVQMVDPGFRPHGVLTLRTTLPRPEYEHPVRRGQFYQRVLPEVRRLPGIEAASYISGLPMVMTGGIGGIAIPGRETPRDGAWNVSRRFATPQYFRTLGIPILRGRDIEDGDTFESSYVAVVSESFVRMHWPNEDGIGKVFEHGGSPRTIVGVVGDVKVRGLERRNEPQIYLPAAQVAERALSAYDPQNLVIRFSGDPTTIVDRVREIVRAADPKQPISDVRMLDDIVAGETATRRALLHVLAALAGIALLLSAVGIHGLLAFMVSQRRHEIGVRLALGAEPSSVARLVLSEGMKLALLGIVVGIGVAYASARGMSALLFGVEPGDPATFGVAVALALIMTLAGALLPAMRAVRVNPLVMMRAE